MNHNEAGLSELLHHAMTAESAGDPGVTAENLSAANVFDRDAFRDPSGTVSVDGRIVREPTAEELAQAQRYAEAKNAKERARVNLKGFIDRIDRRNGFPPTRWPGEDRHVG